MSRFCFFISIGLINGFAFSAQALEFLEVSAQAHYKLPPSYVGKTFYCELYQNKFDSLETMRRSPRLEDSFYPGSVAYIQFKTQTDKQGRQEVEVFARTSSQPSPHPLGLKVRSDASGGQYLYALHKGEVLFFIPSTSILTLEKIVAGKTQFIGLCSPLKDKAPDESAIQLNLAKGVGVPSYCNSHSCL